MFLSRIPYSEYTDAKRTVSLVCIWQAASRQRPPVIYRETTNNDERRRGTKRSQSSNDTLYFKVPR